MSASWSSAMVATVAYRFCGTSPSMWISARDACRIVSINCHRKINHQQGSESIMPLLIAAYTLLCSQHTLATNLTIFAEVVSGVALACASAVRLSRLGK